MYAKMEESRETYDYFSNVSETNNTFTVCSSTIDYS